MPVRSLVVKRLFRGQRQAAQQISISLGQPLPVDKEPLIGQNRRRRRIEVDGRLPGFEGGLRRQLRKRRHITGHAGGQGDALAVGVQPSIPPRPPQAIERVREAASLPVGRLRGPEQLADVLARQAAARVQRQQRHQARRHAAGQLDGKSVLDGLQPAEKVDDAPRGVGHRDR